MSNHDRHDARARLTLVHEGNAVVAGVVPCLLGGTADARPDLHGSAVTERLITPMSAIEPAYTVTRTRTSASVKTVVGARNLDGRLARVHDPVLSAGAVAVVAGCVRASAHRPNAQQRQGHSHLNRCAVGEVAARDIETLASVAVRVDAVAIAGWRGRRGSARA